MVQRYGPVGQDGRCHRKKAAPVEWKTPNTPHARLDPRPPGHRQVSGGALSGGQHSQGRSTDRLRMFPQAPDVLNGEGRQPIVYYSARCS